MPCEMYVSMVNSPKGGWPAHQMCTRMGTHQLGGGTVALVRGADAVSVGLARGLDEAIGGRVLHGTMNISHLMPDTSRCQPHSTKPHHTTPHHSSDAPAAWARRTAQCSPCACTCGTGGRQSAHNVCSYHTAHALHLELCACALLLARGCLVALGGRVRTLLPGVVLLGKV